MYAKLRLLTVVAIMIICARFAGADITPPKKSDPSGAQVADAVIRFVQDGDRAFSTPAWKLVSHWQGAERLNKIMQKMKIDGTISKETEDTAFTELRKLSAKMTADAVLRNLDSLQQAKVKITKKAINSQFLPAFELGSLFFAAMSKEPASKSRKERISRRAVTEKQWKEAIENSGATFFHYTPLSKKTKEAKELLSKPNRATTKRRRIVADLLVFAELATSAASGDKKVCELARESVLLWAANGYDRGGDQAVTFMKKALTGFTVESSKDIDTVIRGLYRAQNLGPKGMGQKLDELFRQGRLLTP